MGYGRKAWTIVAYTYAGEIYCPPCGATLHYLEEGEHPRPVFSSDLEVVDSCGACGARIE